MYLFSLQFQSLLPSYLSLRQPKLLLLLFKDYALFLLLPDSVYSKVEYRGILLIVSKLQYIVSRFNFFTDGIVYPHFPMTVFDWLQCPNTEKKGLGDLVMCQDIANTWTALSEGSVLCTVCQRLGDQSHHSLFWGRLNSAKSEFYVWTACLTFV